MAKTVGRHELSQAVRDSGTMSAAEAERAVAAVIGTIQMALQRGDNIKLHGFGSFSTKTRNARMGRNPRTGEPFEIPPRRVAKFSASKSLLG